MPFNCYCDNCKTNFIMEGKKFKAGIACPNAATFWACPDNLSGGHITNDSYTLDDRTNAKLPEEKDTEPSVVVNFSSSATGPVSTQEQVDSYGTLHHTTKGGKNKGGTNHMRHYEQGKHQAYGNYLASEKKKGNNKVGRIGGGSSNRLG